MIWFWGQSGKVQILKRIFIPVTKKMGIVTCQKYYISYFKVTLEAQLGLIGGTMGLLTGFSILSGVEIVYFVIKLIISLAYHRDTMWSIPLCIVHTSLHFYVISLCVRNTNKANFDPFLKESEKPHVVKGASSTQSSCWAMLMSLVPQSTCCWKWLF